MVEGPTLLFWTPTEWLHVFGDGDGDGTGAHAPKGGHNVISLKRSKLEAGKKSVKTSDGKLIDVTVTVEYCVTASSQSRRRTSGTTSSRH